MVTMVEDRCDVSCALRVGLFILVDLVDMFPCQESNEMCQVSLVFEMVFGLMFFCV